jgi:dolichol kinase
MLYSSLQQTKVHSSPLPASWRIEPPAHLNISPASEALLLSRYNLVNLATFCSTLLLFHVCASSWYEARCRGGVVAHAGERYSVPRSEARRSCYYVLLTVAVSLGMLVARALSARAGLGIWQRTFEPSHLTLANS